MLWLSRPEDDGGQMGIRMISVPGMICCTTVPAGQDRFVNLLDPALVLHTAVSTWQYRSVGLLDLIFVLQRPWNTWSTASYFHSDGRPGKPQFEGCFIIRQVIPTLQCHIAFLLLTTDLARPSRLSLSHSEDAGTQGGNG